MRMDKITLPQQGGRSRHSGVRVSAPLHARRPRPSGDRSGSTRSSAAILRALHPYIREATSKGYIVIAPEYRGSIGYAKGVLRRDDYGGTEIANAITAADVLKTKYPQVDPARIGIIGWCHGGMITLPSIFRNETTVQGGGGPGAGDESFQRLAWKGVEQPSIRPSIRRTATAGCRPRSTTSTRIDRRLYNVDKLQIPCASTSRRTTRT